MNINACVKAYIYIYIYRRTSNMSFEGTAYATIKYEKKNESNSY
jgi:hypothetical protein